MRLTRNVVQLVTGSDTGINVIKKCVIWIFHFHKNSGCAMSVGSTQPATEMSTSNISWGIKPADVLGWQTYHFHVLIVLKSGSLNLLEPSGSVQDCNWIALTFVLFYFPAVCTDAICCVFIHSRNTRNVKFDCGIISLEEMLMATNRLLKLTSSMKKAKN